MKIGAPKEIFEGENRVAMTPDSALQLQKLGHECFIEAGAGAQAGFSDAAYEAAGVDALFLAGVKTRAELDAVAAAVKLPLILGSAGAEVNDLDYLGARGVRICLQGHLPIRAAVAAVYETLKAQKAGVPNKDIPGVAPEALMKRLTREGDYETWTRDWLGGW